MGDVTRNIAIPLCVEKIRVICYTKKKKSTLLARISIELMKLLEGSKMPKCLTVALRLYPSLALSNLLLLTATRLVRQIKGEILRYVYFWWGD